MSDTETVDSWYEHTRNGNIASEKLEHNIRADVVVIGGGLTGCSTALHLAEQGVDVALVEARHIGWGASGRSGGQIVNGYACDMEVLEKSVGSELAGELWQHSVSAVEYTRTLVDRHAIQCDLKMGYIHAGVRPQQAAELEQWVERMSRHYQYDRMQYHDKSQLGTMLGTDLYAGGVFDPGSGHLHPLNYCLGLGHAALTAGVRIFERSPVIDVSVTAQGRVVQCERGSIQCGQVVYGCNAYREGIAPQIDAQIMPVGTYIVATERLSEEVAHELIANRAAVADTNVVLDYFRLSADNRLLFGGRASYSTSESVKFAHLLRKRMLRVFPQLDTVQIDFSWGGLVAITRNRAPHIGRTAQGDWFSQGYSGHGMALTGYVGKQLAAAILGEREAISVFERVSHKAFPGGKLFRMPLLVAAMGFYRMKDRLWS